MFGDNSWREVRREVAGHGGAAVHSTHMSPHMLLAQALAPPIYGDVKSAVPMQELRQNDPPSLQHLSADMLSLHSALQAPFAQETTLHDMLAFYPRGRPHPTCAHVLTNYDGSLQMSYTPRTDDVDPSGLETLARLAASRIQETEGTPAAFAPFVPVGKMVRAGNPIKPGNPIKHDTGVKGVGITSCVLTAVQVVAIYQHLIADPTSINSLAVHYNVARTTINNIKKHLRWCETTKHLWSHEDREAYDRIPKTLRGQKSASWTHDEDETLQRLLIEYGSKGMWKTIAKFLPGRHATQVQRRWKKHLLGPPIENPPHTKSWVRPSKTPSDTCVPDM